MTNLTKIGAHIIIHNNKKEILLCKRDKKFGRGEWELPGGHLEFRETLENCLVRESEEELGIKVKVGKMVSVAVNMKYGNHYVIFSFLADSYSGVPFNKEKDEHSEIKWFKKEDIPEQLFISTKQALENYYSGVIYRNAKETE